VDVNMYQRSNAAVSVEAFNTLGVRMQEVELDRLQATSGAGAVATPDVTVTDLPRDAQLERVELARELAPIAALLCIGVVTSVASILGAARERRSIEPLLLLPIPRRSIARGIALGAFPLACLQIIAAVLILVLTAAIPSSVAHQSGTTLAAMAFAGIASATLLALVATGFGSLAGALGTGTDDAVSLGDLVSVLFVAVGVIVFALPTIGGAHWQFAVPILGQVLLLRDTVIGSFDPIDVLLAAAGAIATFVVLVRATGDRLGDDRRLARAIR
jgi:ABC-type Na+ efflux pump permease subunit